MPNQTQSPQVAYVDQDNTFYQPKKQNQRKNNFYQVDPQGISHHVPSYHDQIQGYNQNIAQSTYQQQRYKMQYDEKPMYQQCPHYQSQDMTIQPPIVINDDILKRLNDM